MTSSTTHAEGRRRQLHDGAAAVWATADLVVKVKEPQPEELAFMRPGLTLFTYLHLATTPGVIHGRRPGDHGQPGGQARPGRIVGLEQPIIVGTQAYEHILRGIHYIVLTQPV